ncbi:chemotaxis coupling protein CheW [Corallococcus coralloides]|uniref:Chemotaxis coupling protein CheW n=1 Tax=Corallococcus coralloides TaxID=184914 RepID=A0A410RXJ6_CORCK|nr:chemotaxis protein CheW [Corallococcus coralloides]QAT86647.1 chemotaxis coupling protein CheW [Corallococcus coralloides]
MAETPRVPVPPQARRLSVQQRLSALEAEQNQLRQELVTLQGEVRLPGLYLTVEAGDTTALVPARQVQEVVRLVALDPLPGAPVHVSGSFVYRGSPAVVVDVARLMGVKRTPDLDSLLVVVDAGRMVALLVDRVKDLVETPVLVDGSQSGEEKLPWDGTGLMAGLCRTPEGLRPLLRTSALLNGTEDL